MDFKTENNRNGFDISFTCFKIHTLSEELPSFESTFLNPIS